MCTSTWPRSARSQNGITPQNSLSLSTLRIPILLSHFFGSYFGCPSPPVEAAKFGSYPVPCGTAFSVMIEPFRCSCTCMLSFGMPITDRCLCNHARLAVSVMCNCPLGVPTSPTLSSLGLNPASFSIHLDYVMCRIYFIVQFCCFICLYRTTLV